MGQTSGILMVAVGRLHRELARKSLASLRSFMPSHAVEGMVTVITDKIEGWDDDLLLQKVEPFEFFPKSHEHKVRAYERSPYGKTLMVDADTLFMDSPLQLLGMEIETGIAAALDPRPFMCQVPRPHPEVAEWMSQSGRFWPHFNTGVLVWERCLAVENLFRCWAAAWGRMSAPPDSYPPDQPAFFVACREQAIEPQILGPEWNYCASRIAIAHHLHPKVFTGSNL